MKKIVVAMLVLLMNFGQVYGNTLYVGGEGNYKNIQDAINDASFFDKIVVSPGFYNENISINKSISLEGENAFIKEISINANNVNISGFIINGSIFYGISIKGNKNVIKNCSIFSNSYGIKIEGKNNTIENNKIFKNGYYGVYLFFFSENNTIINNEIFGNKVGIYLEKANNNVVMGNLIRNNSAGMIIQGGENNFLKLNNFSYNLEGIHICCYSQNNIIFENNFIENSMHVYCYGGKNTWNLNNGNYWDNLSGEIFFINEENIDYCPSIFPYNTSKFSSKIYIFYPEEKAIVSGKIIINGMVEGEGRVRIKIDDGEWEDANGSIIWYYEIDTKNIGEGKHKIYIEFEGNVVCREIYVKNKKSIPSFDLNILILIIFFFVLKNRKNYL